MPDTGAPWNIPYVAGTDLVSDWPTDSQDLAEAIADGLDEAGIGIGTNIVQTVKTDTFSTNTATLSDVTGLAVTITPSTATSKVLVLYSFMWANDNAAGGFAAQLVRDSTDIYLGVGATSNRSNHSNTVGATGSRFMASGVFLDSPATTSATTYKIQFGRSNTGTAYIGRRGDVDDWYVPSQITAIEVSV